MFWRLEHVNLNKKTHKHKRYSIFKSWQTEVLLLLAYKFVTAIISQVLIETIVGTTTAYISLAFFCEALTELFIDTLVVFLKLCSKLKKSTHSRTMSQRFIQSPFVLTEINFFLKFELLNVAISINEHFRVSFKVW